MSAFKKVAVLGASGLLGQPVVKQLVAAGFDLTLVGRDSSKLKSVFPGVKAKFVQADPADPKSIQDALNGVEAVVSLVGAPALPSQKAYIDAALASGVKRFIPSEYGCDTQAPYLAGELIFQAKRDTAAYLKELAAAGKITYTLLITGLFFDNTLPYHAAGVNFKEAKAVINGTGKELLTLSSRDDIGRYIAAVLKHADITENKIIRIGGDTQTADYVVEKYEKKLGKKFDVSYRSAEEIDSIAQEGLKSGNMGAYFSNRIPLFMGTGRCQIDKPTEGWSNKLDNDKFPEVKPESAEQIIAKL